jgi:hypothetical protein
MLPLKIKVVNIYQMLYKFIITFRLVATLGTLLQFGPGWILPSSPCAGKMRHPPWHPVHLLAIGIRTN